MVTGTIHNNFDYKSPPKFPPQSPPHISTTYLHYSFNLNLLILKMQLFEQQMEVQYTMQMLGRRKCRLKVVVVLGG